MPKMSAVSRQVREVSAGTLSYLFNETNYDKLEAHRLKFIEWVDQSGLQNETWVQAWEKFKQEKE